ncbi:hypothetical protein AVEN_134893-1 [Araneus ventricosus]|uniref:Tc1-like transposase DDE domain-containing protein n=1 Tax=Araneus ventricosus TaxID=182803 RepID=A0A4Y2CHK2_ARAVE|nr:hypothetical protein AVEN_134893-1 [Araneus ventricosus]
MEPLPACTVPCLQLGSMATWDLCHTRTLPSALNNRNRYSSNQTTFSQSSKVQLIFHEPSRGAAADGVLLVKAWCWSSAAISHQHQISLHCPHGHVCRTSYINRCCYLMQCCLSVNTVYVHVAGLGHYVDAPTETHQYVCGSPKVNVWCGLLYDRVVGPFFFTETSITSNIYQDLLEIYVFPQIDDLEDVTGNIIVFMQDGSTPHLSPSVREALNERFPNSWIGRDVPIQWPV